MSDSDRHGHLMDQTYRYQRIIYDITRKYYLLGRDHMIARMDVAPGDRVLEVACGTGRNLAKVRRRYPQAQFFGLDISEEMLTTARAKLGKNMKLAQGDACNFDPEALFGVPAFDHIILSYSLSMIPDWTGAMAHSKKLLSQTGQLHVVDFGDSSGLPRWFQTMLQAWLKRFHVSQRHTLAAALQGLSEVDGETEVQNLFRRYSLYGKYTKGRRLLR